MLIIIILGGVLPKWLDIVWHQLSICSTPLAWGLHWLGCSLTTWLMVHHVDEVSLQKYEACEHTSIDSVLHLLISSHFAKSCRLTAAVGVIARRLYNLRRQKNLTSLCRYVCVLYWLRNIQFLTYFLLASYPSEMIASRSLIPRSHGAWEQD